MVRWAYVSLQFYSGHLVRTPCRCDPKSGQSIGRLVFPRADLADDWHMRRLWFSPLTQDDSFTVTIIDRPLDGTIGQLGFEYTCDSPVQCGRIPCRRKRLTSIGGRAAKSADPACRFGLWADGSRGVAPPNLGQQKGWVVAFRPQLRTVDVGDRSANKLCGQWDARVDESGSEGQEKQEEQVRGNYINTRSTVSLYLSLSGHAAMIGARRSSAALPGSAAQIGGAE